MTKDHSDELYRRRVAAAAKAREARMKKREQRAATKQAEAPTPAPEPDSEALAVGDPAQDPTPAPTPTPAEPDLSDHLLRWKESPVLFAREALGLELAEWQESVLGALPAHRRVTIRAGRGVGKAQPVDTMVPTPLGMRRFGALRVGDAVFGPDGLPTSVVAVHERGKLPVYRVTFDDGSSTLCCEDHLWTVRGKTQKRKDRVVAPTPWVTKSAGELLLGGLRKETRGFAERKWEIPRHLAVGFHDGMLPIDPYVLGAWLGDGSKGGVITSADAEVMERIQLAGYVVSVWGKTGTTAKSLRPDGLGRQLVALGVADKLSYEKRVPWQYMRASTVERLELLRGLMDTDGYCDIRGISTFSTSSQGLAEDVMFVVRSLGGKARLQPSTKKPFYRNKAGDKVFGRPNYIVTIRMPLGMCPFHLERKKARWKPPIEQRYLSRFIDSIEPEGEADCRCITVDRDDGLYLTNDFIVTHNSSCMATIILHQLLCFTPVKVMVTAPKADQAADVIWAEVEIFRQRLPKALADSVVVQSDSIFIRGLERVNVALIRTARADNPDALRGAHSENIVVICEESSGIADSVFDVLEGTMTTPNSKMILVGNMSRTSGYFHDSHYADRSELWFKVHVNAETLALEGLPWYCDDFMRAAAAKRGVDSDYYRVEVRGERPQSEEKSVIPRYLVEAAVWREVEAYRGYIPVWGLDVGRARDRSALAKRCGNVLLEPVKWWAEPDTTVLIDSVIEEYRAQQQRDKSMLPSEIMVDAIGLGGPVCDALRRARLPVRAINVGEAHSTKDRYLRKRDELWFKCREWFDRRDVKIPNDPELIGELSSVEYEETDTGKQKVQSKDSIRNSGRASPDLADAFILTFAGGWDRLPEATNPDRYKALRRYRRSAGAPSWMSV